MESEVVASIEQNWENYKTCVRSNERDALTALQNFKEAFQRLGYRYDQVKNITETVNNISDGEDEGMTLHEAQIKLVDRIEAYHQQVYSVISGLSNLMNHFSLGGSKAEHPINSNKRFLEFLKENNRYRSQFVTAIDALMRSIDYRAKFIDHPQQHLTHDWMTFSTNEKSRNDLYIIHFIKYGNEIYAPGGNTNPEDPTFRPPINCGDDFYVSPNVYRTQEAMTHVVGKAINVS